MATIVSSISFQKVYENRAVIAKAAGTAVATMIAIKALSLSNNAFTGIGISAAAIGTLMGEPMLMWDFGKYQRFVSFISATELGGRIAFAVNVPTFLINSHILGTVAAVFGGVFATIYYGMKVEKDHPFMVLGSSAAVGFAIERLAFHCTTSLVGDGHPFHRLFVPAGIAVVGAAFIYLTAKTTEKLFFCALKPFEKCNNTDG